MTKEELKQHLANVNNPQASLEPGMVCQVWEDGELTCQKSGDLLWQRTLHMFEPGIDKKLPLDVMPVIKDNHGWVWVKTSEEANKIREEIINFLNSAEEE